VSEECDREASIMRRAWPTRGCCAMGKKVEVVVVVVVVVVIVTAVVVEILTFTSPVHASSNVSTLQMRIC
jgi:hypothetical protein